MTTDLRAALDTALSRHHRIRLSDPCWAEVSDAIARSKAKTVARRDIDPEGLASVLEQITAYSDADAIREHLRTVVGALRGNGLVILNGPPQEALRTAAQPSALAAAPAPRTRTTARTTTAKTRATAARRKPPGDAE